MSNPPISVRNRPKAKPSVRRTLSRIRTVPGLGRDSVALAIVIILAFISTFIILSGEGFAFPWSPTMHDYKLQLQDAVAISPGSGQQVRIAGVPEGKILGTKPSPNGTSSIVTIAVRSGHPVYSNASAVLTPINPLNEMYIELNPGGPPGTKLAKNQMIPETQTQSPVQLDSVLDQLTGNVRSAITELIDTSSSALASSPSNLGPGLGATDTVLQRLQPVVQLLDTRQTDVKDLVTALSQISTAVGGNDTQLTDLINSTQQTLGVLDQHSAQLDATLSELPGFTSTLTHAMNSTTQLTGQLNPVLINLSAASKDLPSTLDGLTTTVKNLQPVIADAKPVVADAQPVVTNLTPLVANINTALNKAKPLTACLPQAVAKISPWMYDLGAFIDNSLGIWHNADANGIGAQATFAVNVNDPLNSYVGTVETTTGQYQQAGSPLGPYQPVGPSC